MPRGLVAFLFLGTGHEQGAGAEQLGAVGLPFDGAIERQGGLVEPALPLSDLGQKGMGMVGLVVELNGRLEVGDRLVELAGVEIHAAAIDQQDVAVVRVGPQFEGMLIVDFGGPEVVVRLKPPLGSDAGSLFDREQRPIPLLARDQGAEEVETQQVGGRANARVQTVLGLAVPLGVEVEAGQQEMSTKLVGVELDGGQGRADRLAVLAVAPTARGR